MSRLSGLIVRRMKARLLLLIALVLWWWAVWGYWSRHIPAVPQTIIPVDENSRLLGPTTRGEVITFLPSNGGRPSSLQMWSFPEGRPTREAVIGEGFDSTGFLDHDLLYVTTNDRSGRHLIFDVETMTVIDQFTAPETGIFSINPERGQVLCVARSKLYLRNVRTHEILWTAENYQGIRYWTPPFIVTSRMVADPASKSGDRLQTVVLDAATGERVTRFDGLGELQDVQTRRGSPYALVKPRANPNSYVCRLDTGEIVSTIVGSHPVQISVNGNEVYAYSTDRNGVGVAARWRCSDGAVLVPPPTRSSNARIRAYSPATGFGWETVVCSRQFPDWLTNGASAIQQACGLTMELLPQYTFTRVMDVESGEQLALLELSRDEQDFPILLPDRSGFVMIARSEMRYFTLPPSRSWLWLAFWTMAPPLLVVMAARYRRRRAQPLSSPLNDHISTDRPL